MQKKTVIGLILTTLICCLVFLAIGTYIYITGSIDSERSFEHGYASSCRQVADYFNDLKSADSGGPITIQDQPLRSLSGGEDMVLEAAPVANAENESQTNVQVEGIDESYFFKTDGDYVYFTHDNELTIATIDLAGNLSVVSTIQELPNDPELFVYQDTVTAIGTSARDFVAEQSNPAELGTVTTRPGEISQPTTTVITYDISDRSNPKVQDQFDLEGTFTTAGMQNGYVYLISSFYSRIYQDTITADNAINFLPQISIDGGSFAPIANCEEVGVAGQPASPVFTSIITVDLTGGEYIADNDVFWTRPETVYMSTQHIYVAVQEFYWNRLLPLIDMPMAESSCMFFDQILTPERCRPGVVEESKNQTYIYQFAVEDSSVDYRDYQGIDGYLLNQFSLDEYEGFLRVAVTENANWSERQPSQSNLIVIDANSMQQVGFVGGMGEGEQIYSVRFMGDEAYVVTFRQVDPFYVLDLTDPTSPVVTGELKLPGFSNYLHKISENTVLGIGKQTETQDSGRTVETGVKLALFDITDPTDPQVKSEQVVGASNSYTSVNNDHRSLYLDDQSGLMVLPIVETEQDDDADRWNSETVFTGFYVYDLSDENLDLQTKIDDGAIQKYQNTLASNEDEPISNPYFFYNQDRGIVTIGDYLLTYGAGRLQSHSIDNFTEISSIDIDNDRDKN